MINNYIYFEYLDPSVLTYSIQVIFGIIIAISAFIGVYWRKVKKYIEKKFDFVFNSKREVESDDIYKK